MRNGTMSERCVQKTAPGGVKKPAYAGKYIILRACEAFLIKCSRSEGFEQAQLSLA